VANTNVRNRYVDDGAGVVPQPRLLVMLYDRLVLDLEQANAAMEINNHAVTNDKLIHAQAIIMELHAALDHKVWTGASNLASLYLWFNEQLIQANIKKDRTILNACHRMIRELQLTWHKAYEMLLAEQAGATQAAGPAAQIAAGSGSLASRV
jgi:flagellar secretion chaperone FliS